MFMTKITLTFAVFSMGVGGCASSPRPDAESAPAKTEAAATATPDGATKPDAGAAKQHLAEHVKYPATRAEILAACAETPEFTGGEKQWLSDHLAEGSYASADDVAKALGL